MLNFFLDKHGAQRGAVSWRVVLKKGRPRTSTCYVCYQMALVCPIRQDMQSLSLIHLRVVVVPTCVSTVSLFAER